MTIRVKFGDEIREYLSIKSRATRDVYATCYRRFLKYYQDKYGKDKGFTHFLDRIYEEMKKPRREQKRVAEIELVAFIDHLKELGKSNNTIRLAFTSLQNFLKYKGVVVSSTFVGNLPPATGKKTNGKHKWKVEHIKEFVELTPLMRDKAIALCLFQSGLGINELIELNYGDIADEYEKGILPICLDLVRKKTGIPFKTFFGRDAVKYLTAYLKTRPNLKHDSPLFCKHASEERITYDVVRERFGAIAPKLSFLSKHRIENGNNPIRPHSLRSGFKSRLTGKIDRDLIEFWMGHKLLGVGDNYLNLPTDELRELYQGAEKYLAIEKTSLDEKMEDELNISQKAQRKISSLEQTVVALQNQLGTQQTAMDNFKKDVLKLMDEKQKAEWAGSQDLLELDILKEEVKNLKDTIQQMKKGKQE